MTAPCSDSAQAKQIQRERAGSTSSDQIPDNTDHSKEPSEPGTDSDRDESDSEDDDITALLRPLTPSYNPVDHSGPAPDDVAIPRGRVTPNVARADTPTPAPAPAPPHPHPNPHHDLNH